MGHGDPKSAGTGAARINCTPGAQAPVVQGAVPMRESSGHIGVERSGKRHSHGTDPALRGAGPANPVCFRLIPGSSTRPGGGVSRTSPRTAGSYRSTTPSRSAAFAPVPARGRVQGPGLGVPVLHLSPADLAPRSTAAGKAAATIRRFHVSIDESLFARIAVRLRSAPMEAPSARDADRPHPR